MATLCTLLGNVTDLGGSVMTDSNGSSAVHNLRLFTNLPPNTALTVDGTTFRLDNLPVQVAQDGSFRIPGVVRSDSTGLNIASGTLQYQLRSTGNRPFTSSWLTFNASNVASDGTVQVVAASAAQALPPDIASAAITRVEQASAAAQGYATSAQTSAASALASKQRAEEVALRSVGQRFAPFSMPQRLRWRRTQNKKITGPTNGQELTLHQVSGSGMGLRFWLAPALDNGDQSVSRINYDGRVRIYFDGEATPSIDLDAAVFLGYLNAQYMNPGSVSTDCFVAKADGGGLTACHGMNRLMMPFSNGIRIALANTTNAGPSLIYSQFDFATVADNSALAVPGYRLTAKGDSGNALRGVNPDADVTLHTIAGEGFLAAHFLAARTQAPGGRTYLERQIEVYRDGESSPSIKSSGTEDWFDSSFYYDHDTPFSRQGSMGFGIQNGTPWATNQLVDFLSQGQSIDYSSALTIKWVRAVDLADYCAFASAIWYYRKVVPPMAVRDDFERSDTTTGIGTATTGQTWTNAVGTWGISSGQAYNASNTSDAIALIETGSTTQDVTFTYGSVVGSDTGLIFGGQDGNNCYIYDAPAHAVAKKVNGSISGVPNPGNGPAPAPSTVIRVTITPAGVITVYQDGTQLYSITDTNLSGGTKVGLFAPGSAGRFASFAANAS